MLSKLFLFSALYKTIKFITKKNNKYLCDHFNFAPDGSCV